MAHVRKQIRDEIIARLLTDLASDVSTRVFPNRFRTLMTAELPAILVYTLEEQSEKAVEAPREYSRKVSIAVEIVVRANDSLDDTLDALAEKVENSIFKDETWGGKANDTLLGDTSVDLLSEGEKPVGGMKIELIVDYNSRLPEDSNATALDDLETVNAKIDVSKDGVAPDGTIESEDTIDVSEEA